MNPFWMDGFIATFQYRWIGFQGAMLSPCCLDFFQKPQFWARRIHFSYREGRCFFQNLLKGRFLDLSPRQKKRPFSLNDPTDDFSAWNTNAVLPRKKDVETGIPRAKTCPLKCTSCLLEPVLVVETTNQAMRLKRRFWTEQNACVTCNLSTWWFQLLWKHESNWIISPGRGENNKYLKPPPCSLCSFCFAKPIPSTGRLYIYRSMNGWFLRDQAVGKYTKSLMDPSWEGVFFLQHLMLSFSKA